MSESEPPTGQPLPSRLNHRKLSTPNQSWRLLNHLSERGATLGSLFGEVNFHPAGGPVWNHSPSGPGRTTTSSQLQAAAGVFETPLGERCHSRIPFRRGQLSPSRRPSVGPLSEWARQNHNKLSAPSRSWRLRNTSRREVPLSDRFSERSTFTQQAAQCGPTLRVGQAEPQPAPSSKPQLASLNHLSERGATLGSLFGEVNFHPAGGPVWDHSPSGPGEPPQAPSSKPKLAS